MTAQLAQVSSLQMDSKQNGDLVVDDDWPSSSGSLRLAEFAPVETLS